MIRKVEQEDIKECVDVIVRSFMTVADEFGFTIDRDLQHLQPQKVDLIGILMENIDQCTYTFRME